MLRPAGHSVAWMVSPQQPLLVGPSIGFLGCSSLGCGKAERSRGSEAWEVLGTVFCDRLPGTGKWGATLHPGRVLLTRSGCSGAAVPLNLPPWLPGASRPLPLSGALMVSLHPLLAFPRNAAVLLITWLLPRGEGSSRLGRQGLATVPPAGLSTVPQERGRLSNAAV